MSGCEYQLYNGTSMILSHFPGRKKPVIVAYDQKGRYLGHAVFKDDRCMKAFEKFFDELLRTEEIDER